jgi:hypothetical protein
VSLLNKNEVVEENLATEGYIRKLEDEISNTDVYHLPHFILTMLTGVWLIVWLVVYHYSKKKKKRLQRLIIEYRMLSIKNKSDGE